MTDEQRPRPRPRPGPRPAEAPRASVESDRTVTADDAPPTELVTSEPSTEVSTGVSAAEAAGGGRPGGAVGLVWVGVAAVVVLALVGLNIWLAVVRSGNDNVEQARVDAERSARQRVPAMLSYDYKTVSAYAASAPRNATGAFKKDFSQLVQTVIAPAAKQQQITTKAQVKSVGVVEAHESRVVVLVLLDQTTSSKTTKTPRLDGSRVRVTMRPSGGTWLVAELTPI